MKKLFVLGVVFTLLAATVSAQGGPGDRIQRQRIERGFQKGQLTRPEKARLQKDRAHMKMQRHHAMRDGRISPSERRRLHRTKRHNSREIFRMKHNGRKRVI